MTTNNDGRMTEGKSRIQNEQALAGGEPPEPSDADLRLLRLFNHYRHDWMNDLQMVMGYIQLKKVDKLSDLMEKIKEKVRVESCVSKLGIPSLIVYLLSFQAEVKELQLLIRLEEEIHLHKYRHAAAAEQWITSVLDSFKREAEDSTEMQNSVILRLAKEADGLRLIAEYEGAYEPERMQASVKKLRSGLPERCSVGSEASYGESRVIWTIHLT